MIPTRDSRTAWWELVRHSFTRGAWIPDTDNLHSIKTEFNLRNHIFKGAHLEAEIILLIRTLRN